MEQLTLKSKLRNVYDYQNIDLGQFALPLKADQARYERDFNNFCKRFATKKEAAEIAPQDMATISCSSENPKFNKSHITVRVGLGLYSKELEQKLVGMPVGAAETFTVGSDRVTVTVEKCIREIIPELTDELAASCGIPHVKTVEDIHSYCRFKQYGDILEEAADNACAYFVGEILKNSTFDLDTEELEATRKYVLSMMNLESMEEAEPEEAEEAEEAEPEEEAEAEEEDFSVLTQDMVDQMGTHALMSAILGQNIKPLTEQDYEEYISKRAVAKECAVEKIRGEYPVTLYLVDTYGELFTDTIEAYVLWKLKEAGEKLANKTA